MKKYAHPATGYTAAVCLLLLVVATSIFVPTYFRPFFRWQFERRGIPAQLNIEMDELMRATDQLLDYMRGREPSMEIAVTFADGVERAFFTNEREIVHMVDVYYLYRGGRFIRNAAAVVLVAALGAFAFFKISWRFLALGVIRVMAVFFGLLGLLVVLIAMDFGTAFTIFHNIFFSNDYWILNPRESRLIVMLPQGFFVHISIFMGAMMAMFSVVLVTAAAVYLRKTRPEETPS